MFCQVVARNNPNLQIPGFVSHDNRDFGRYNLHNVQLHTLNKYADKCKFVKLELIFSQKKEEVMNNRLDLTGDCVKANVPLA